MISLQNVSKSFGRFQALKNISFEIKNGEMVGFLGQNGAGKTTLMRILTTYFAPSSGKMEIVGKDPQKNPLGIRRRIGYLPETAPIYPNMSIYGFLKFAAELKGIPPKYQHSQIAAALEECDLEDVRNKTIAYLSKGYKQRLGIAQAILNDPPILILDEPTTGLDPIQIVQVRKLIKNLENKRTVILSTHILSEIEQLVQRVIILKKGEILADDTLDQLLMKQKCSTLEDVFFRLHNYEKDARYCEERT